MSDPPNTVHPKTAEEARQAILGSPSVRPVGHRSKACLPSVENSIDVSMADYSGMLEYEPSEFTFTAKAGTTLRETVEILRDKGQYLPFDPMLENDSATLGGTIAAGLSGPARFRFGGIRDFLVGASILLSNGDVVTTGGKVVKNAAGFDVPKLMIGSLGSLGLIVDVTFKVFPQPPAQDTVNLAFGDVESAITAMSELASSNLELECIDFDVETNVIWIRVAGMQASNRTIIQSIAGKYPQASTVDESIGESYWKSVRELDWRTSAFVAKCPCTLGNLSELLERLDGEGFSVRVSAAGQMVWVSAESWDQLPLLSRRLQSLGSTGLVIRSDRKDESSSPILGLYESSDIARSIKRAMDPETRFPTLN